MRRFQILYLKSAVIDFSKPPIQLGKEIKGLILVLALLFLIEGEGLVIIEEVIRVKHISQIGIELRNNRILQNQRIAVYFNASSMLTNPNRTVHKLIHKSDSNHNISSIPYMRFGYADTMNPLLPMPATT